MQLLKAKEVEETKNKRADDIQRNIRKYQREEATLIAHVNNLRAQVTERKKKILSDFQVWYDHQRAQKNKLAQEVRTLEEKIEDGLQPIYRREKALNKKETAVADTEAKLAERESALAFREKQQEKTEHEWKAYHADVMEKHHALDKREAKLTRWENKIADREKSADNIIIKAKNRARVEMNRVRRLLEQKLN